MSRRITDQVSLYLSSEICKPHLVLNACEIDQVTVSMSVVTKRLKETFKAPCEALFFDA